MKCTCQEIQKADPLRHFKGCHLREPLPEGHATGETLAVALLRKHQWATDTGRCLSCAAYHFESGGHVAGCPVALAIGAKVRS